MFPLALLADARDQNPQGQQAEEGRNRVSGVSPVDLKPIGMDDRCRAAQQKHGGECEQDVREHQAHNDVFHLHRSGIEAFERTVFPIPGDVEGDVEYRRGEEDQGAPQRHEVRDGPARRNDEFTEKDQQDQRKNEGKEYGGGFPQVPLEAQDEIGEVFMV